MEKCKKCGAKMNIPKGHADLCYDCDNEEEITTQNKCFICESEIDDPYFLEDLETCEECYNNARYDV
jgi:hypothetical protein